MKLIMFIFVLLFFAVFVFGCDIVGPAAQHVPAAQQLSQQTASNASANEHSIGSDLQQRASEIKSCTYNAECTDNNVCVDGHCATLETIRQLNCDTADTVCTVREIVMATNTGELYQLTPGRGSYTSAGALEWKTERAQHCEGNNAIIPILIGLRNYGQLVGEYYITLSEGQNSTILTHPTISSIKFQLIAEKITSSCGSPS